MREHGQIISGLVHTTSEPSKHIRNSVPSLFNKID